MVDLDYFVDLTSQRATVRFSFNLLMVQMRGFCWRQRKWRGKAFLIILLSISTAPLKNKHLLVNSLWRKSIALLDCWGNIEKVKVLGTIRFCKKKKKPTKFYINDKKSFNVLKIVGNIHSKRFTILFIKCSHWALLRISFSSWLFFF